MISGEGGGGEGGLADMSGETSHQTSRLLRPDRGPLLLTLDSWSLLASLSCCSAFFCCSCSCCTVSSPGLNPAGSSGREVWARPESLTVTGEGGKVNPSFFMLDILCLDIT